MAAEKLSRALREERYPDESFVELSDGVTHYRVRGPVGGPTVVLVHGLTSPDFIWEDQVDALAGAGFRVMSYDLYGRGLSDRPTVDYDGSLFVRQLDELIEHRDGSGSVHLVGLSMGGAVSALYAARHSNRVDRLTLMAPGGLREGVPWILRLLTAPLVGECLFTAAAKHLLLRVSVPRMTTRSDRVEELRAVYREQFRYRGYVRALLSTLRHGPLFGLPEAFRRAGRERPVLALWGEEDRIVPPGHAGRLREAIPRLELTLVPGAGHTVNFDRPARVNERLIRFLRAEA